MHATPCGVGWQPATLAMLLTACQVQQLAGPCAACLRAECMHVAHRHSVMRAGGTAVHIAAAACTLQTRPAVQCGVGVLLRCQAGASATGCWRCAAVGRTGRACQPAACVARSWTPARCFPARHAGESCAVQGAQGRHGPTPTAGRWLAHEAAETDAQDRHARRAH